MTIMQMSVLMLLQVILKAMNQIKMQPCKSCQQIQNHAIPIISLIIWKTQNI